MLFNTWPVVIDPACSVITLQQAGEESHDIWKHLFRVQLNVGAPFVQTNATAHVFGNDEALEDCELLICYDTLGHLTEIYRKSGREWSRSEVPEEAAGRPARFPSVRFVFADDAEADQFLVILQRMQTAVRGLDLPDPDDSFRLMTLLLRQPHPPRRVAVYAEPSTS